MSVYERRYEVHTNRHSHYTDDPAEALRVLDRDPENGWAAEGYPQYRDDYPRAGVTEVTRRQIGPISRAALAYRAYRQSVQAEIDRLRRLGSG